MSKQHRRSEQALGSVLSLLTLGLVGVAISDSGSHGREQEGDDEGQGR